MRSTIKTVGQKFMQRSKITAGVFLLAATMLVSCEKDDDEEVEVITEADAADVVEGTLSASTYGIAETVEYACTLAEENEAYTLTPSINCGQVYPKNMVASASTANYSYNYSVQESYQLTCTTAGFPQAFLYSHEMNGSYEVPKMSSNDNAESAVIITGLEPTNANVTVNGTYERNGAQQSKVRNKRSFESMISYNLTNLSVNKSQQKIQSGTATLAISLTAAGVTKTYNASLTFLGNNSATLVINGNSYSLSW